MAAAPTTLLDVLRKTTEFFASRRLDSPRLDAEVLIAHGLGLRRLDLYLQFDRPLQEPELASLRPLVRERGRGVPVAYLTGVREFYARTFRVRPEVLVPRPETEGLVEAALEAVVGVASPRLADVGTGTGCVALAVLAERPDAHAIATDVSPHAVALARENALALGLADRFEVREGSVLEPWRGEPAAAALDVVVSNPPYVVRGDPGLASDVAAHEPALALYVPGTDPLEVVGAVADAARSALRPGGTVALEIGAGSGPGAVALLHRLGFVDVALRDDLARVPRVVVGRAPGEVSGGERSSGSGAGAREAPS